MRPCRCMEIGYRMRRRHGRRGREPSIVGRTAFILQTSVVYASFTGSIVQASLCMNTGAQLSPSSASLGQDARQQINTARLIILGFGNFGASGIESRHHESSVGIMWLETKFLRVAFLEIHKTEEIERSWELLAFL